MNAAPTPAPVVARRRTDAAHRMARLVIELDAIMAESAHRMPAKRPGPVWAELLALARRETL